MDKEPKPDIFPREFTEGDIESLKILVGSVAIPTNVDFNELDDATKSLIESKNFLRKHSKVMKMVSLQMILTMFL